MSDEKEAFLDCDPITGNRGRRIYLEFEDRLGYISKTVLGWSGGGWSGIERMGSAVIAFAAQGASMKMEFS